MFKKLAQCVVKISRPTKGPDKKKKLGLADKFDKSFIQLLDSNILIKQQKLVATKEMLEVVEDLKTFFTKVSEFKNDEQKSFIEGIDRAFSLFEWNTSVAATPLNFTRFSENGKSLLSSILKLLGVKGCGILIIEIYVKLCLRAVSKMREEVEKKNLLFDKTNFKLLLEGFSLTSNMLKKYWHISFSSDQKNTLILCLHQICKILSYLFRMIKIQNTNMKNYSLNLLTKCLIKIETEIHGDGNFKSNNQKFIMIMDFCLYKLNELSSYTNDFDSFIMKANDNATALKPVIDEILCCVMCIAKVTNFEEDYFAILAGSQKVFKEYNDFSNIIKEEKICEIKLNASSLMESLCSLEQKVNIAVLKLVLEVFSSGNLPLKNILNKCRVDILKDNKASEDLNVLISDFDSEMDKIMQIGFFAISCTTSQNRILQIQSCLASLESLETELIPSLTALYVSCTAENKTNFQCLFDFWLNEIKELKVLIDSVLDPAGFCGVVKNQINKLGFIFKEDLSSSNLCWDKLKCNYKQAIKYSKKLINTLKTSMKDETKISETTEDYLRKFQLAVQECEAILEVIDEEQHTNKIINQAARRYEFLMHILDKLSSHLYLLVDQKESFSEQADFTNVLIPQKNYYKLCETPEVTLATRNVTPEILTPYVNKGILRSKKRNVMYTTPVKVDEWEKDFNSPIPLANYWDKTPVSSRRRSRCCKPLTPNLELENTIDLEISTILEKISCLSDDFSKTFQNTIEVQHQVNENGPKYYTDTACGLEKDDPKPTYTSSGCCTKFDLEDCTLNEKEENSEKKFLGYKLRHGFLQTLSELSQTDSLLAENDSKENVDSPNRMNDLKIVEERINFLKTRMPFGLP